MDVTAWKEQMRDFVRRLQDQWHQRYAGLLHHTEAEPVCIEPKRYKKLIIAAAAGAVILVGSVTAGIYEYVELQSLREENTLREQQMQIMKDKTASLQEKMDKLDALDQELRQMVKGAGTGESPKGDGGMPAEQKKSPDLSNANLNDLLHATARLETKVNARLVSFITLKTVLSDTAGDQVREMQQITKKYESSTSPIIWPVKGTITSNFGYRGNPIGGGSGFHEGIDIAVDYGTPVRATATGKVSMSGWVDGYGNLVEINHGGGFVTRYGHNSMLLVVQGQEVKTGDIIALAGSTGRSTGPHCHYEVRVNGTPTDPLLFLP